MKATANLNLSAYKDIGVQTGVESASAHKLILMLMDGALEKISTARGHMQRGELAPKGENIGWAISIIGGLRDSLNVEAGGGLATNLDNLYEYMSRRLVEANRDNDSQALQEVMGLLSQIRGGWSGIQQQAETIAKQAGAEQTAQTAG